MTDHRDMAVDSAEGIAVLMDWARAHRAVLNDYHRKIARKHDVSTDGVLFAELIPTA